MTTVEEVQQVVGSLKKEAYDLRMHISSLMWHMRGGLSREEAWTLCPMERQDLQKLIEERVKLIEKTKLPL